MDDDEQLAATLLKLLQQNPPAATAAFTTVLHADVRFGRLAYRATGRGAVVAELQKAATLALMQRLAWRPPARGPAGLLLQGDPVAGSLDRCLMFTLRCRDGLISEVLQQFGAPVAAPPIPLALTPTISKLINDALANRHPMLLAYTDEYEQPRLSFRGSVQVYSTTALALWVRNADGDFLRAIAQRPRVALMLRNEETRATYQFQGRARVLSDALERRTVYQSAPQVERDHDFAMAGAAVLIELDRVEGYAGMGPAGQMDRVLMCRDATAQPSN